MTTVDCIFCNPSSRKILLSNDLCYARWDSYPVNPGHLLLVPFRHCTEYFEATKDERAALWQLLDEAKALIDDKHGPDGLNVGINIGSAAGQSVFHVHVHVIPRYTGDVANPRGGVRGVIPSKQTYVKRDRN